MLLRHCQKEKIALGLATLNGIKIIEAVSCRFGMRWAYVHYFSEVKVYPPFSRLKTKNTVNWNSPLTLRNLKWKIFQFMLHTALDQLDEIVGSKKSDSISRWQKQGSHWIGMISKVEDSEIYAYTTASNVKFLAMVHQPEIIPLNKTKESDIRKLFVSENGDDLWCCIVDRRISLVARRFMSCSVDFFSLTTELKYQINP